MSNVAQLVGIDPDRVVVGARKGVVHLAAEPGEFNSTPACGSRRQSTIVFSLSAENQWDRRVKLNCRRCLKLLSKRDWLGIAGPKGGDDASVPG